MRSRVTSTSQRVKVLVLNPSHEQSGAGEPFGPLLKPHRPLVSMISFRAPAPFADNDLQEKTHESSTRHLSFSQYKTYRGLISPLECQLKNQ